MNHYAEKLLKDFPVLSEKQLISNIKNTKHIVYYSNTRYNFIVFVPDGFFMDDEVYHNLGFVMGRFIDLHNTRKSSTSSIKSLEEFRAKYFVTFDYLFSISYVTNRLDEGVK